jgi:holo-[acyl-carrier protein] synthase
MVVMGVGLDVVDVAAFASQLADPASGFLAATYRSAETRRAHSLDPPRREVHLAGRFAAKEALVKAWSSARRGSPPVLAAIDLREIEVVDDGFGRPALRLHGAVAAAVRALSGDGAEPALHLSISHDGPVAAAVVVVEATGVHDTTR